MTTAEHVDRFGDFHIRYTVEGGSTAIEAKVWEVAEWAPDGTPIFFNAGPSAPVTDHKAAEPLFEITVKWDGCSHMRMPYLHFDSLEEYAAVGKCVEHIYDELCERHNVMDI